MAARNPKPLHRRLLEQACDLSAEGNHSQAVVLFRRSAKLGNLEAQVNLANALDEGIGALQDFAEARRWYQNAARRGLPEAAYNLAISYKNRGRPGLAAYWFRAAHRLGDPEALIELERL